MSAPWLDDGDIAFYHGDALQVLRSLPAGIAQTCVTSPPYWGLRDYGTGSWTGGLEDCDHVAPRCGGPLTKSTLGPPGQHAGEWHERTFEATAAQFREECGWCGARRVDDQLGLEASPDQYVERLVAVMREVWRVLRADGTLWLNLGSSYSGNPGGPQGATGDRASRTFTANARAFSARPDAPSRGMDGTAPLDSPAPGSACRDLCDGCEAALSIHTADSSQPHPGVASRASLTGRGKSPAGSAATSPDASPRDAQASTTPRSSLLLPGECSHCANCGACLSVLRSSSRDAGLCARTVSSTNGSEHRELADHNRGTDASGSAWLKYTSALKPKDMVPIPWMVAMALQADGWYLRSDIIWAKPNPMPESVTDRPTKAHEYLFLLAKQPRYYYDADAIREAHQTAPLYKPGREVAPKGQPNDHGGHVDKGGSHLVPGAYHAAGRNARSVWEVATQPTPEAHFATYPEALVRRCILAGTSEAGECSECGTPWQRQVERGAPEVDPRVWSANGKVRYSDAERAMVDAGDTSTLKHTRSHETTGWAASCACDAPTRPQLVLDPFVGSGTTPLVARKHGRRCIGIDLSESYLEIAAKRTAQLSLLGGGEVQELRAAHAPHLRARPMRPLLPTPRRSLT